MAPAKLSPWDRCWLENVSNQFCVNMGSCDGTEERLWDHVMSRKRDYKGSGSLAVYCSIRQHNLFSKNSKPSRGREKKREGRGT